MPRGCRAVVVLTFSSAGLFFVAAATTVTAVPAAIWWAQEAAASDPADAPAAVLSPAPALAVPTSPDQWFAAGGRNQGTEWLVDYLSKLARQDNDRLAVTSGWGRTWGSAESDHHASRTDSWACDLAVPGVSYPTAATETAARRLASALGEPGWAGGQLIKTVNGYRFQLLWKVADHYDHVHIGVRKL